MNPYERSLIPQSKVWLRMLQLGLLLSSAGWGISFWFTFVSWESASEQLYLMGAGRMGYRPLLDYWLKMASSTFGCIGIASLFAAMRPHRFEGIVRLLGPFHVFLGVVLTVAAIKNHLKPDLHPTFVADITFCFLTALLILVPLGVSHFRHR